MAYIDNPNGFRCVGTLASKEIPPIRRVRLAASQTIAAGDFLIASSGYASIALYTSGQLAFLAMESKTSTASTHPWIQVIVAMPDVLFEGQCSGTAAIGDLFTPCDIEGATGVMEINEDANVEDVIIPMQLSDEDTGYGANARLQFLVYRSPWNLAAK